MPKIFAKITLSGGLVDKFLVDKYKENHAIIAVTLQFGYKSGKVEGLNSVREVSEKPLFYGGGQDCRVI